MFTLPEFLVPLHLSFMFSGRAQIVNKASRTWSYFGALYELRMMKLQWHGELESCVSCLSLLQSFGHNMICLNSYGCKRMPLDRGDDVIPDSEQMVLTHF